MRFALTIRGALALAPFLAGCVSKTPVQETGGIVIGGGEPSPAEPGDPDYREPLYGEPGYESRPNFGRRRFADGGLWDNGWDERGMLLLGRRNFRAGSLPDGDNQFTIGVEFAGAPRGSFLELELAFFGSAQGSFGTDWLERVFGDPNADEIAPGIFQDEFSTSSLEISIGARKEIGLFGGALRPFVGAGLSGLQVRTFELQNGLLSDRTDGVLGFYAHAGLRYVFDGGASVGFDVRNVEAADLDLGLSGQDIDGGYTQWGFLFTLFL